MSKISVEFDTKTKAMSVKLDGKAVPDVVGVNLSKSYYSDDEDAFQCSVTQRQKDEDNDIQTWTQLVAADSESADGKRSAFAGFLERPVKSATKVENDIRRYFED